MTLALYGKSRKRQGGLLLAAFLAVIAASLGGLAVITGAFAHHLTITYKTPTCADQTWSVTGTTGGWSEFREAVITAQSGPAATLDFSPFVYHGGDRQIFKIQGSGTVNSTGTLSQYSGTFGNSANITNDDFPFPGDFLGIDNGINATTTVLTKTGDWNANYAAGKVVRIDNELMKIESVDNSTDSITVTRGFGGTTAVQHKVTLGFPSISVWNRGSSTDDVENWSLNFDSSACTRTVKVIKTATGTHPAQNFPGTISPGGTGASNQAFDLSLAANGIVSGVDTNTVSYAQHTVTETAPLPAGWTLNGYIVKVDTGSTTCSNTESYTPGASATVPANGTNYVVCIKNSYDPPAVSPTVKKVAHTPSIAGGFAYWDIVIDQPATNAAAITGLIIDDFKTDNIIDSVSAGASCSLTVAPVKISCNIGTGDVTIVVKRPINAETLESGTLCQGTIANKLVSAALPTGGPLTVTEGTSNITYPISNPALCDGTLSITKGSASYDGPSGTIRWAITISNSGGTNLDAYVYDAGTSLVSYTGCTSAPTEPQTDVYKCTVPSSGATLVVSKPYAHTNKCLPYTLDNSAVLLKALPTHSGPYNAEEIAQTSVGGQFSEAADLEACGGTITFVKDDGVVVGSNIRWKITVTSTWQIDKPAMIEDVGTTNVTATLVAGDETCVGTPTMTGDVVTCSVPASSSAYFHVETAIPPYTGANKCIPHTETNVAHLLDAGNTSGNHDANDASDSGEYVIPATADAACIMVKKLAAGPGDWNITFTNSGPAADINFSDTYQDGGSNTDIVSISGVTGCTPGQPFPDGTKQVSGCNLNLPTGVTVIAVKTETPANTCNGWTVGNTVAAFMGTGSPSQGASIPGDPSGTTTASSNYSGTPGECTVTLNLCKQWTIEPGEQVVDGKESFEFTVGSNGNVVISDVEENTHGKCIGLVVTIDEFGKDGLGITEDNIVGQADLTGFVTPLVSINGGPSVPGPSVTVPLAACQEEPFLKVIDQLLSSIESLVTAGEPAAEPDCTVLFINDDTENNLPTGNIQIEKYLDINGDGDANDAGEGVIPGWEMTTTCQQSIPGADVQDTNASGIVFIPGLAEGDNCTVTEELPSGWQVTRVTVNGANFGPTTSANVTVPGSGATAYVRFFNRQLGGISVHKTTVNVLNGIETVNTNDDDGWTITVKSALCGIDLALDTDANGNAVFSGLPMCTDYVVAEILASGEPGYSPVSPASVSGKTPTVGGNTQVNFTNETRAFTPPCPNCTPGTQTVPTPTPTPPTPTPPPCVDCAPGTQTVPTPIPTTGGTNPSPVSTVAGEKTPGPGQTPIAPSTGEGGSGGSSGGLNLMLVLGGLGALAAGITFMAMGRKNRS